MQAVIYCFDKAAHENSTRSRYKLNMRIYYEDFLSALTSAAQFKYSGGGSGGGGDSTGDSDRRSKLKKIVNVCSQSMAMKVRYCSLIMTSDATLVLLLHDIYD